MRMEIVPVVFLLHMPLKHHQRWADISRMRSAKVEIWDMTVFVIRKGLGEVLREDSFVYSSTDNHHRKMTYVASISHGYASETSGEIWNIRHSYCALQAGTDFYRNGHVLASRRFGIVLETVDASSSSSSADAADTSSRGRVYPTRVR
jgi:hypothetical protein